MASRYHNYTTNSSPSTVKGLIIGYAVNRSFLSRSTRSTTSPSYIPPCERQLGLIINSNADLMAGNAILDISSNMRNTIMRYVMLQHGLSKKRTGQLLTEAFRHTFDFQVGEIEMNNEEVGIVAYLQNWLQYYPEQYLVEENLVHFIRISYEIMRFFDSFPADTPDVSRFSILPLKHSTSLSHFSFCTSSLYYALKHEARMANQRGESYTVLQTYHEFRDDKAFF